MSWIRNGGLILLLAILSYSITDSEARSRYQSGNHPKRSEDIDSSLSNEDYQNLLLQKISQILVDLSGVIDAIAKERADGQSSGEEEKTPAGSKLLSDSTEELQELDRRLSEALMAKKEVAMKDPRGAQHIISSDEDDDTQFRRILTRYLQQELE